MRLRQLNAVIRDDNNPELWPLALVNVATCLEWFARSLIKHLIDNSAERMNPNAKLLRDLKINYGLILQAHTSQFSIGDIVAMSRNFSSFDEIEEILLDLTKEPRLSILARVQESWANLTEGAFRKGPLSRRTIVAKLNLLFRKRHELVHGSPRYLAYDDQLEGLISKRELLLIIHCSIRYMQRVVLSLNEFIPELSARTTRDNNLNQGRRLDNSEKAILKLERVIENRLKNDSKYLVQFRRAQHAWRTWRNREADFQTTVVWGPTGSGRPAILMGFETSINMDRLRNLEACIREMDKQERVNL